MKPVQTIDEHIKSNFIVINFFRNRNSFSYDLITSVIDGGVGIPRIGAYKTIQEARQAAYNFIMENHTSPKQKALLPKFRFIKDYAQPDLFDKA